MKLNATRITFFIDVMTKRQRVVRGKLRNVDAKRSRLTAQCVFSRVLFFLCHDIRSVIEPVVVAVVVVHMSKQNRGRE